MSKRIPTSFFFDCVPSDAEPKEIAERRRVKQAEWLDAVGVYGWRKACELAHVDPAQVMRWLRMYPEFAQAHAQTMGDTAQRLEVILDAIAAGEIESTPSQMQALQFRLRGLRPEVYRDRSSVTVDATTRTVIDGDGGRARLMLADWIA